MFLDLRKVTVQPASHSPLLCGCPLHDASVSMICRMAELLLRKSRKYNSLAKGKKIKTSAESRLRGILRKFLYDQNKTKEGESHAVPSELPECYCAGSCHIQGIDLMRHWNPNCVITICDCRIGKSIAFCAKNNGKLVCF